MLEINDALRKFWSQFGLPVFFQNLAIVDDAQGQTSAPQFPYFTFEYGVADFAEEYAISARLWTRDPFPSRVSAGFSQIYWDTLSKVRDAVQAKKGILLDLEDNKGVIFLTRGTPFILHNVLDDDRSIKSALINLNVKYYTK